MTDAQKINEIFSEYLDWPRQIEDGIDAEELSQYFYTHGVRNNLPSHGFSHLTFLELLLNRFEDSSQNHAPESDIGTILVSLGFYVDSEHSD